ncbi:hypothetical protein [Floccifex sp.]|uniref:hypothetical protein n=1 Tax=Floccifex sp. TaxID=2815810 RepID=UPI002A748750|nr:hypothetical protein [Floccifex sp.]MDD7282153.1 hypothetical protein [Erysipelotrichaceae bacterium]MDY2959046.1 hypothetical protein [Floccifex sp.]
MKKTIAIIIVVAIVMMFLISTLKKSTYKRLVNYLENGDFTSFYKEIDSKKVKMLLNNLNIIDMKLNAAIVQQNKQETNRLFDEVIKLPLTPSQKEHYYMKAFNYYVGLMEKKKAKKYIDLINTTSNERMKLEANRVYNIYILKNDKDLRSLLLELKDLEDSQKGVNEYLISLIYKNKGDLENAAKYEELSKEHFALVDEQTAKKYEKELKEDNPED